MITNASCHCGAVKFSVRLSSSIAEIRRCNCSLCSMKNAVMGSVKMVDLTITAGADFLSLYQWNSKVAKHYFCKNCGIYTHHQRRSAPDEYAFNITCLEDKTLFKDATLVTLDGASFS